MKKIDFRWFFQRRVLTLAIAILVELAAGTLYNFSAYGPNLKKEMDLKQDELNFIATAGNFGLYAGFTAGLLYDKVGFRITTFIASIILFVSYFLAGLSVRDILPRSFIFLIILYVFIGQGSYGMNISALDVNIKNWERFHRGKITGTLAGAFGLSSALFTLIYSQIFSKLDSVMYFLMFMGSTGLVVGLIGLTVMKLEPIEGLNNIISSKSNEKEAEEDPTQPLLNSEKIPHPSIGEQNLTPIQLIKTLDYYIIFLLLLLGSGAGLMVINNLGSIYLTFEGSEAGDFKQSSLVTILSLSNFSGRIIFGLLSDRFENVIQRSYWLTVAGLLMFFFHITFYFFPGDVTIFILAIGTGFAYGGYFASIPTLVSLFFGVLHFGANFGLVIIAPALGAFGYGEMFGILYERQKEEGSTQCYGNACFQLSFFISSILSLVAAGLAVWLAIRRKKMARDARDEKSETIENN